MAVSKRTRFEVFRRDNYTCRYCRSATDALRVDHVTPLSLGGTDDPSNLVAACQDCNAGKAASSPDEATVAQVADDAMRWAAAIAQAAEMRRARRDATKGLLDRFRAYWKEHTIDAPMPYDWEQSVLRFIDGGLSEEDVRDAVDTTIARVNPFHGYKYFRYFAGVCWNMLRDLDAEARKIIESGGQDA